MMLPPWIMLLLCCLWQALAVPLAAVHAVDRPPSIHSIEDAEGVEDPRTLTRSADHWRDHGQPELARALYEKAQSLEELQKYMSMRPYVREALLLEHLGRHEESAALWRQGWDEENGDDDVLMTILALRIDSEHPERSALVDEALAHVRGLVEVAKSGGQALIYHTSKGAPRYLQPIADEDALQAFKDARGGRLSYCYIDRLDLSEVAQEDMPDDIFLNRCVVGSIRISDRDVNDFKMKAIVFGDVDLGKTWSGAVNASAAIPGSRFDTLMIRESVILGRANFQEVQVRGRIAYWVLSSFEGLADFRDTEIQGMADYRFSVFAGGANFKNALYTDQVYLGHTRYLAETTFRGMFSEQMVYLNSVHFEQGAVFDQCEWARDVTFENGRFEGPVSFRNTEVGGRLNMSRTIFQDVLQMKEMQVGGMDFIGAWLQAPASFVDVVFSGKVRFSLDDITRAHHLDDPSPLLSLYRQWQGDKDQEEPITTRSSYGVEAVDDLIARIDSDISFANSVFEGFCIFERVSFGTAAEPGSAEFYNTQFQGETHFERTIWHSAADFSTIFSNELSFNEATFHRSLIFDDANVAGRLTLTDAHFTRGADISLYGAEIESLQISREQLLDTDGDGWFSEGHRLFYERCADGDTSEAVLADIRMRRLLRSHDLDQTALRRACHDRAIDEFVSLKSSFGDRAMTAEEDWAYWWIKHTELMEARRGLLGFREAVVAWVVGWPIFELAFGWGVRLGNLAWTLIITTVVFAWIYRVFCPDTIVVYRGDDVPLRDIPWHGLIYISLQTIGAFNTGWDFGEDDWRFQYLNTLETFLGIIILTFFVGAYTRIILA
jgi:uncharacterized protein YjbI with pentapeptide repeats